MATRTTGRIILPKNPAELLELANKIYKKHQEDGATSPLNAQQDFSWATEGPKVIPCKTNHEKAEEASKQAEQYYRQRDIDLPAIRAIVQNSAQLLKSIYAKNPKVLGEYGLVVDDSKPTKKAKE
ncbi:hypothetical protein [Flavobacterium aciduliphilum]|uniref:Uncharacterized protein n=1 Tax=Flavobacterium aciduliphilum TaxID=1101402 RepID=A0A328YJ37_9FLAO|nr:hypothetical protein [Flavobacterium aciduliphilum]RAR74168.1 hypothetical protein CLV55_10298 [Flavobacterium aciduliphilum]